MSTKIRLGGPRAHIPSSRVSPCPPEAPRADRASGSSADDAPGDERDARRLVEAAKAENGAGLDELTAALVEVERLFLSFEAHVSAAIELWRDVDDENPQVPDTIYSLDFCEKPGGGWWLAISSQTEDHCAPPDRVHITRAPKHLRMLAVDRFDELLARLVEQLKSEAARAKRQAKRAREFVALRGGRIGGST